MGDPQQRAVGPGAQPVRVDKIKARSWVDVHKKSHIIGQMFFETGKADLDSDDQAELQKIVDGYAWKLNVKNVPFSYYGLADYRHTKDYNQDLSEQRAKAVADWVGDAARLGRYRNYGADARGLGIDYRSKHFPAESATLSYFRRVDIFAESADPDPAPKKPDPGQPWLTSTEWRARLLGGGAGGAGVAIEAFRVEIIDLKNKLYMHFWYKGAGAGVGPQWAPGSFASTSKPVDFNTSVPIRIQDFEGFAHHTGAQLSIGAVAGSIDWLTLLGPYARHSAKLVDLEFKDFSTFDKSFGIGAITTVGSLEPTEKFRTPHPW